MKHKGTWFLFSSKEFSHIFCVIFFGLDQLFHSFSLLNFTYVLMHLLVLLVDSETCVMFKSSPNFKVAVKQNICHCKILSKCIRQNEAIIQFLQKLSGLLELFIFLFFSFLVPPEKFGQQRANFL